jgi:type I restriction enzyme M protein
MRKKDESMKIEEREELHRTIWSIANDLRGAVDGWDFKQILSHYYKGISFAKVS